MQLGIKRELNSKLEEFTVSSDTIEEIQENKEQIEISKFYEKLPNPAIIATEEFINDELSYRELGKIFNLDHKTIKGIFAKLKYLGVYLQLNITEVDGAKEYWVLNPYISWKGKLKSDSLFITFTNTRIVRLL